MGSRSGGADEIWCFYCAVKQPKANVFRPSEHIDDVLGHERIRFSNTLV